MKAKLRAEVLALVEEQVRFHTTKPEFHVLSIRFANGRSIEIPFLPWKPRTEIDLPGRWEVDQ